jgi:hypothetical protein
MQTKATQLARADWLVRYSVDCELLKRNIRSNLRAEKHFAQFHKDGHQLLYLPALSASAAREHFLLPTTEIF